MGTFESLVEILRLRSSEAPLLDAYEFLEDGEEQGQRYSHEDLDRRARAIAAYLQARYAPGERALLLYPPGLEYIAAFFGCLYAGLLAVPGYPPRFNESLRRIDAIRAASGARLVLTSSFVNALVDRSSDQLGELGRLDWISTDEIEDGHAAGWKDPGVTRDTLAFLQYTSGSTGTPKGVMVSHGNLLDNLKRITECFEVNQSCRGVFWLPPYHDMGLIGAILSPLYVRFPATLMSPLSFIQRPAFWLETLSRRRATVSGGPDFAFKLCVRKSTPEQRATWDLSSWRCAFNGA